jgi:HD-GYP domain-containing protein (c-di-GMP phosphodiesterase class II)
MLLMLAEQLVGEARARRPHSMSRRERAVVGLAAALFLAVAVLLAVLLPSHREADPALVFALVGGYAVASRVRFEFGNWYVVPELLLFVPLVLLAPLPYVPLLVGAAALVSTLPDFINGSWHRERALSCLSDSWFSVGPVLVLAALAPGEPALEETPAYVAALAAQFGVDLVWTVLRDRAVDHLALGTTLENWVGVLRFDAILAPVAFAITMAAADTPAMLLTIGPLVWLLEILSRDRRERYAAALELQRAYRGTVMLLSDVIEFDDEYTADHSRSVVDLVHGVADELGIDRSDRQELEFAALLHDIGKITIPKEILHKPTGLTAGEFEVMKRHTIEGQTMLDRVGGLLGRVGEIVRSCHERWDGTGYPDGLKGEEIPLESRIVFAADTYNAMTTDRPYRPAMTREQALKELAAGAGTQFDPRVAAAVAVVIESGEPIATAAADEVRALLVRAARPKSIGAGA